MIGSRPSFFVGLIAIATSVPCHAAVIVAYDTTNPNFATTNAPAPNLPAADEAPGVTALDLARGPGVTPASGIAFNSSGWSTSSNVNIGSGDYISWGWSSSPAYDLEALFIEYDVSDSGPRQLVITAQFNDDAPLTVFTDASISVGDEELELDLTAFDAITSAEFRLFGFDAGSAGGTLDIERYDLDPNDFAPFPDRGIILTGDLTAVPEPTSLLAMAVLGSAWTIRRRSARGVDRSRSDARNG